MEIIKIKRCGIRKSFYLFGKRMFSWKDTKVDVCEYVESLGVKVGKNVSFITLPNVEYPISWPVFASEPYLVEIGDNSIISFNTTFITHDGSLHNFKKLLDEEERDNLVTLGKIKIGKNCFIGCNSIILPDVSIGDNSIIGAGSVVTKNIPEGEVWAGCPAKFIKKTSNLAEKCSEFSKTQEAKDIYRLYLDGYKQYIEAQ